MSMVVVHVASGTRDILVFWAAWPRLWATPYTRLLARREIKVKVGYHNTCKEVNFFVDPDGGNNVLTK